MISEYNETGNFMTSMKACVEEKELKYDQIMKIMSSPDEVNNFTKSILF